MIKKLTAEDLKELLGELRQKFLVIAPFRVKQGRLTKVLYQPVKSEDQLSSIYLKEQPDASPKEYFLPRDDRLGEETAGADCQPEEWSDNPRLFLGVRSCDIAGIELFDDVFTENDFVDPFYQQRRDNSLIIGYSCQEPADNSFCQEVGIDPLENENVPLMLYDAGEGFYLKVQDQEVLKRFEILDMLQELPEIKSSELEEIVAENRKNFSGDEFSLELDLPFPEKEAFTSVDWEEATASCLGCGVCTFYCPTCFCFKFFWEEIEKNRAWDSCMFSLFTAHASGHNPRETQDQRWRQRLLHKFSYHPTNYQGSPGCVGCGRCVSKCPVNLDIRRVLDRVEKTLAGEGVKGNES